jgi:hypothetical protein
LRGAARSLVRGRFDDTLPGKEYAWNKLSQAQVTP